MKNLMKVFLTIVTLMLIASSAHAGEWKKIRIGVEGAYPPFSSITSDGKLVGFDIDIAKALCQEMGAECVMVKQDWDGILPALLARKYDAIIASMSITAERKKKVAFTNPYYFSLVRFVRKKGSGIEITPESMKGKTVGVQRASTWDNFITGEFAGTVKIKRYATQDEAYMDAVAGRVDLLLANTIAVDEGFLKTDKGKDFEFVGLTYTDPKYFGEGVGIACRKKDKDLVDKFNKALAAIIKNGTYKKINDKYFDFNLLGK